MLSLFSLKSVGEKEKEPEKLQTRWELLTSGSESAIILKCFYENSENLTVPKLFQNFLVLSSFVDHVKM